MIQKRVLKLPLKSLGQTRRYDNFDFFGLQIRAICSHNFQILQSYYARNLSFMPTDLNFPGFRRLRVRFSWLLNTHSKLACFSNQTSYGFETHISQEKNTGYKQRYQGGQRHYGIQVDVFEVEERYPSA